MTPTRRPLFAAAPTRPGPRVARLLGPLGRQPGLLLGALVLVATACAAPPPAATDAAAMLARIRAEVGTAACTQDTQCQSLPLGERACGGPEQFLAWSTAHTSPARLQPLAEQFRLLARERNAQSGMMSTCQVLVDPGARCDAGRCVLRQRATVY